jgi:hypothetical protein
MANHSSLLRLGFESLDIGIYWHFEILDLFEIPCLGFRISFRWSSRQAFSHEPCQPFLCSGVGKRPFCAGRDNGVVQCRTASILPTV